MANPFLVLGGIAVGIITAAFGVLAVPGWVAAAQDASATNDLASIAIAQAAAMSATGSGALLADLRDGWAKGKDTGVRLTTASPALHVAANAKGDKWAAVGISDSGHVLVRTWASPTILRGSTPLTGDASAPLTGSAIPSGLPAGVTVSGTRALPIISVDGVGEGAMVENVLTDTSFANASAWALPNGASIVTDSADGRGGSLQITATGAPRIQVSVPVRAGALTPVKPGETWQLSAFSKISADWNGTSDYSKLRTHYGANVHLHSRGATRTVGAWQPVTTTFTIPDGVTEIGLIVAADHTTGTIWWDDIHLERVTG